MKVCRKCDTECEDTYFGKGRHVCNSCRSTQRDRAKYEAYKKEYVNRPEVKVMKKAYNDIWTKDNREKVRAHNRSNYRKHTAQYRAAGAKYRAIKKLAVPSWADLNIIKEFYEESKYQQGHIDHIVPLQHKLVCGLHVEHNLQLLSPEDNLSKSNTFKVG